jgi:hypothetical protein
LWISMWICLLNLWIGLGKCYKTVNWFTLFQPLREMNAGAHKGDWLRRCLPSLWLLKTKASTPFDRLRTNGSKIHRHRAKLPASVSRRGSPKFLKSLVPATAGAVVSVPDRIFFVIVLMVFFRRIKLARRNDLGEDRPLEGLTRFQRLF